MWLGNIYDRIVAFLMFGSHAFEKIKRKAGKEVEVKRSVRADMRKLAGLYLAMKDDNIKAIYGDVRDMVRRENFTYLKRAIEKYTTKEDHSLEASLTTALYYQLKQLAKTMKGKSLMENSDTKALHFTDFMAILEHFKEVIFADATCQTYQRRQVRLRRPGELPLEQDIEKLHNYILQNISKIVSFVDMPLDSSTYVKLRNLVCARLTLFNARRGREPARLLMSEWEDAEKGAWVDQQRIKEIEDPLALKMIDNLKITYQMGKGF